jgi:methionine synthase II (cobalamin-independent)
MTNFSELRQRLFHPYYILHMCYGVYYVIARSIQLIKGQSINFEASFLNLGQELKLSTFNRKLNLGLLFY